MGLSKIIMTEIVKNQADEENRESGWESLMEEQTGTEADPPPDPEVAERGELIDVDDWRSLRQHFPEEGVGVIYKEIGVNGMYNLCRDDTAFRDYFSQETGFDGTDDEALKARLIMHGLKTLRERYGDLGAEEQERTEREVRAAEHAYTSYASECLLLLGYRGEDVNRIVAAAVGRLGDEKELTLLDGDGEKTATKGRFLSQNLIRNFIIHSKQVIDRLGAYGCAKLTDECGILNFTNYNKEELHDQLLWLNGDLGAAMKYSDRNNPAMVYVQDGIGDWNGAFSNSSSSLHHSILGPDGQYQKVPQLFFEVNGGNAAAVRAEVAKYNQILSKRHAVFSKLLVGGHGGDNGHNISFGGAYLGSRRYDAKDAECGSEEERIALYNQHNMLTWEDETMRDLIKAVTADANGERTIILKSCSQAKKEGGVLEEIARQRLDDEGVTRVFGVMVPSNFHLDNINARIYASNGKELASVETTRDGRIVRKEYEHGADLSKSTRDAAIANLKEQIASAKGQARRDYKTLLRDLERGPQLIDDEDKPQGVFAKLKQKMFNKNKGEQ
jgi:hypothetical protein